MFITVIENFVLFSTGLALASFIVAWTARLTTERGWWQPQPFTLARLYAVALIVPPVAAMWLVAAALLPEWWLAESTFSRAHTVPVHQLHLLSDVTAALEPRLAYATLLFAFAASAFAAWSGLRGYARVNHLIQRLEMNAAPPPPAQIALVEEAAAQHNLDVGLVMSDATFSFVWGFRRSKLVLSSGLLHALTPEELAGVLEHEAAHHRRGDNIVKLLLSVCSYASLAFPLSRFILRWRAGQVELVCDEVAVSRTSSPLEIADALVKVRRRFQMPGHYAAVEATPAGASGFVPDGERVFEQRVLRLIAFADRLPTPARANALSQTPRNEILFVTGLFATTLVLLSTLAPLAVHRVAESIIRLIN